MSLYYGMSITIENYDPKRAQHIKEAASAEWNWDDWYEVDKKKLSAYGESNLAGGETEEEFAERVYVAVWKANGKYCDVTIEATYLEDLPTTGYYSNREDYRRLLKSKRGRK